MAGENIGEFGELTAILQCFTYRYFPYPNIFNRRLLLQLHTWTSPCIVRLLLYLSFKISLNHLPAMDLVIASIRIIAITGQRLSCFYLPHVLIAKCGSLVYSEFKHTKLDYRCVKAWWSTSSSRTLQVLNY